MIRKPTERDFRESAAVSALRETRAIAHGAGSGLANGLGRAYGWAIGGLMAFGLLATLVPLLFGDGYGLIALVLVAGLSWRRRSALAGGHAHYRAPARHPAIGPAPLPVGVLADPDAPVSPYRMDSKRLGQRGTTLLVPGLLLVIAGPLMPFRVPAVLGGLVMLMVAFLLFVRMTGDRTVLAMSDRGVAVTGLLGTREMSWAEVERIALHSFSRFDVPVLFTSGSPHNLVIEAGARRANSPRRLLVPLDLTTIDDALADSLMAELALRQARGGLAQHRRDVAIQPPGPVATILPEPVPAAPSGVDPAIAAPFDADAFMALYLEQRRAVIAANRPELIDASADGPIRPNFGRKRA